MILTDELCDKLCAAAREKSREAGVDISFAISDENGLPRAYRRYGEALVLSITLVPGVFAKPIPPLRNAKQRMLQPAPQRELLSWRFRQTIRASPS